MTKDQNYTRYVVFFTAGIVLVLLGSGLQEGDWLLDMITDNQLIDLLPLAMQGIGIYLTVRSIFYYIRYDLEERYGIHEWGHIKKSIDFFTKSSKVKADVDAKNGGTQAQEDLKTFQDVFSGGIRVEHVTQFNDYNITYAVGHRGDSIGPLTSNEHLYFMVLKGRVMVETKKREIEMDQGDGFHLLPGEERTTHFLDDMTEALLVTIQNDD